MLIGGWPPCAWLWNSIAPISMQGLASCARLDNIATFTNVRGTGKACLVHGFLLSGVLGGTQGQLPSRIPEELL
jgi:hypothetical protein